MTETLMGSSFSKESKRLSVTFMNGSQLSSLPSAKVLIRPVVSPIDPVQPQHLDRCLGERFRGLSVSRICERLSALRPDQRAEFGRWGSAAAYYMDGDPLRVSLITLVSTKNIGVVP
jgi:hypothetical protein